MRRVLSILLVALFGFTPLVALAGGGGTHLALCCRRSGAHHCEMPEDAAARIVSANSGSTATIGAPTRCPLYPGAQNATLTPVFALAPLGVLLSTGQGIEHISISSAPHVESSSFGAHSVRGPPAVVLG